MGRHEHDGALVGAPTDESTTLSHLWGPDAVGDDSLYRPTERISLLAEAGTVPRRAVWPDGALDPDPEEPTDEPLERSGLPRRVAADDPARLHRTALVPVLLVAVGSLAALIVWTLWPTPHDHGPVTASVTTPPDPSETALPSDPLPPVDQNGAPLPGPLPAIVPTPGPTHVQTVVVTPPRPTVTVTETVTPPPVVVQAPPAPANPPAAAPTPAAPPTAPVVTPSVAPVPATPNPVAPLNASWQPSLEGLGLIALGTPTSVALAQGWLVSDPRSESGFATAPSVGQGVRLVVADGQVDAVVITDPALTTAQGVHAGLPLVQAQAAFGGASQVSVVDADGAALTVPGLAGPRSYLAAIPQGDAVGQLVIGQKHTGRYRLPITVPAEPLAAGRPVA